MLRCVILLSALAAGGALQAGIWPEQFSSATRTSRQPAVESERAVWNEYGLEEAERAEYRSPRGAFSGTAWRLKDSTGALAVFEWQRPARATASKLGRRAAEFPGGALAVFGNYCFRLEGTVPPPAEFQELMGKLPRLDQSSLPSLAVTLPSQGLVANSERYVVGPASLARFEGRIPPSVAAFHYGVEAHVGRFRSPAGEMTLLVFSFPTPHIAREREPEFRKLPSAMVKRSGPLLAVVLAPPDANQAEILLSKVQYQAELSWSQRVPSKRDNIGNLIINVFILIGVLLGFSLVSGLAFGGLRALMSRVFGWRTGEESMITLHLNRE